MKGRKQTDFSKMLIFSIIVLIIVNIRFIFKLIIPFVVVCIILFVVYYFYLSRKAYHIKNNIQEGINNLLVQLDTMSLQEAEFEFPLNEYDDLSYSILKEELNKKILPQFKREGFIENFSFNDEQKQIQIKVIS